MIKFLPGEKWKVRFVNHDNWEYLDIKNNRILNIYSDQEMTKLKHPLNAYEYKTLVEQINAAPYRYEIIQLTPAISRKTRLQRIFEAL